MKVAICGYPPFAVQIMNQLKNVGIECTHFIEDYISSHGEQSFQFNAPPQKFVNFFEFRKLINSGEIDGLIIAESQLNPFTIELVKICKLYDIQNVLVTNIGDSFELLYKLNSEKVFIPYLETNIIDSCNLNCKGCTHFANLFNDNDVYKVEDFRRDIKQLSDRADVLRLRLLGGEPLKLKNIDQYCYIARQFLPHSNINLVTNGLLIANTPKYIFDCLRENRIVVAISLYPPTLKYFEQISKILSENKVIYGATTGQVKTFNTFMSLHGGHDPEKARRVCGGNLCRFLRDGKIYKCPIDALSFRFAEHFGLKGFPASTGIDIFAKNFSSQMEHLDGNIELCTWCNETNRQISWTPENNPAITDWLAEPAEIENLLPK